VADLYLVRHGETDWNAARRIQGTTDIPLNDTGRRQAHRTARLLRARPFVEVVTSPLSRARETATIIADALGLPAPRVVPELIERDYGAAEGLDYRTLDRRFPEGAAVPGRETREQVAERVLPALSRIAEGGDGVVVVTHGGVIRSAVVASSPDPERFAGVRIPNGSVHSFRHVGGTLSLVSFDDPIEDAADTGAPDLEEQNPLVAKEEGAEEDALQEEDEGAA